MGAGIPVAYFEVTTFDDYERLMLSLIHIFGWLGNHETSGLGAKAHVLSLQMAWKSRNIGAKSEKGVSL